MKAKLMAILMAVTMVFAMAPLTMGAAFADDENADEFGLEVTDSIETDDDLTEQGATKAAPKAVESYNLWVGKTQVTSEKLSGNGWSYSGDKNTGTLTLNNLNIGDGNVHHYGAYDFGICSLIDDLTIVLKGKSNIALTGSETKSIGFNESLTITGSGSLNAESYYEPIGAGTLTIKNTTITAKSSGKNCPAIETTILNVYDSKVKLTGSMFGVWIYDSMNVVDTAEGYDTRFEVIVGEEEMVVRVANSINLDGVSIVEPADAVLFSEGYSAICQQDGFSVDHVIISNKYDNTLSVKGKSPTVKYSKLKKKNQTIKVSKAYRFSDKGQGKLSYKKSSGNKKITVNKAGKITVKKGLKKGKYKVKVKVTAAGDADYAKATRTVTVTVKVK